MPSSAVLGRKTKVRVGSRDESLSAVEREATGGGARRASCEGGRSPLPECSPRPARPTARPDSTLFGEILTNDIFVMFHFESSGAPSRGLCTLLIALLMNTDASWAGRGRGGARAALPACCPRNERRAIYVIGKVCLLAVVDRSFYLISFSFTVSQSRRTTTVHQWRTNCSLCPTVGATTLSFKTIVSTAQTC